MVQEQEINQDDVLTYDPNLDYGWETNQPYALSIADNFDTNDTPRWYYHTTF